MRRTRSTGDGRHRGVGTALVGLLAFVLLTTTGLGWTPLTTADGAGPPPVAAGVFSGMFVAGAGLAALVSLRRHVDVRTGWSAATGALLAAQALLVSLPVIAHGLQSAVDLTVTVLGVLLGTSLVVGALVGIPQAPYVVDYSFAVGLGMGLVASGNLLVLVALSTPVEGMALALMVLLVATQLATVAVVVATRRLPLRTASLVAATALVVAAGLALVATGRGGAASGGILTTALAAVGAAWIARAWCCVRDALRRSAEAARHHVAAAAMARDERERLHELRSTMAGLVNGSALLDHADIDDASRTRIWGSVRHELDRMQRLLSDEQQETASIDLDEALGRMLDLQGLKGRRVELRTSGELVQARPDALAEVVNILVDNAATHGGSDSSLIEVARRDEDTVDITVTDFGRGIAEEDREAIFEWGRRGPDSPGEGIGLHLAQRLVTEDGGSLRLREAQGTGSSFVISLPAPRRAPEDHVSADPAGGDRRAWHRSG